MKKYLRSILVYLVIFVCILLFASAFRNGAGSETKKVQFSVFAEYLEQEKISEINITGTKITGLLSNSTEEQKKYIYTYAPYITEINYLEETYIYPQMEKGIIKVETDDPNSVGSIIVSFLPSAIMILALIFLFYFMMNQGGQGKAFSFGKSRFSTLRLKFL